MPETKKKILVLEDEVDLLKVIQFRLESAGYEVVALNNGQQGLDHIKKDIPDLVVSDVLMPVMDGFTFYKSLKQDPRTARIPVLILTARGQMEDSFRVLGADEFMSKPFEPSEFLGKIRSLIASGELPQHINKKILLGAPDRAVLSAMSSQLTKMGCTVEVAKDGPEIISKAVQFVPDALIMEIPLYSMQGHDVVKILREISQFSTKPIMLYHFYNTEDLGSTSVRQKAMDIDDAVEACLNAGANINLGRFNEFTFFELISAQLKK